jgi:hypothetical protein
VAAGPGAVLTDPPTSRWNEQTQGVVSSVTRRREAVAALLAAVAATATDWGYLSLIHEQNATSPNPGITPFITVYVAAIAAAAVVGAALILCEKGTAAETVLVAASVGSGALGILAIFSIGLALIITAILLATAAGGAATKPRRQAGWLLPLFGALVALGVLGAGLAIANA